MPSGGFRPGAGRPRKNPTEQKLEGKPKPKITKAMTPKPVSEVDSADLMADYFAAAMKECSDVVPSADALRTELEGWIAAQGCAGFVAPQTISDYILNRQGYLACEALNRKIGRLTKDMKLSPYVTAAQGYYKAMREDFNLIIQTINRHGGAQSEEKNEFLALLTNRGF